MKAEKTRINREQAAVNRIRNLYEQVINTGMRDSAYREKLTFELLGFQKPDGSFSVIDNYRVDADIRVFYVYEPTYYATAALMFMDSHGLHGMDPEGKKALLRGLAFAEGRRLSGHGFDATRQQLQALKIYKDAGLYEWISKYGSDAPSFTEMVKNIIISYKEALQAGRTISDWNTDFRKEFEAEVSDYEEAMVPFVWYACYGSNMCAERFMAYIRNCADKTPPAESRPFTIPYGLYFAGDSETWGRGHGVAFIDDSRRGSCPGRIYKIRRCQFSRIQEQEGRKYGKKLLLGTVDGIPVYSFTSPERRTDEQAPGADYIRAIMAGLQETYPEMSTLTAMSYLISHGALSEDDRNTLLYIKNSEHAVPLKDISGAAVNTLTRARASVKKLADLGLIRQDSRSVRAGHRINNPDAFFYTCAEMSELISLIRFSAI